MVKAPTTVLVALLLATCSSPPTLLEQIIEKGELKVVTRNSPTTYYLGAEEPIGPEYELAAGFAEHLGVRLNMRPSNQFWQILPRVESGQDVIAAAGLTVTPQRQEMVEFGPVYQRSEPVVVYRSGRRRPRELTDLVGGSLEVVAGTSFVEILADAQRDLPDLSWTANPNAEVEELIAAVANGTIDFTVADSNEFSVVRYFYPEARIAFALAEPAPLAWALPKSKDNSLREAVANYFSEIGATGELDRILNRYYASYAREFDYVGSRAFQRHFDSRLPSYRPMFERYAADVDIDWRLLAAMAYQESHWDPGAVSPTGVRGLMMLTQQTARMMGVADRTDPLESIEGGARYFRRILRKLPDRIPEPDRTWLAVAAYNVGFGHLEDARIITESQGGDPDRWRDVRTHLPLLSQKKWYQRTKRGYASGWQPVFYVDNVQRYYDILRWMTADEMFAANQEPVFEPLTGGF